MRKKRTNEEEGNEEEKNGYSRIEGERGKKEKERMMAVDWEGLRRKTGGIKPYSPSPIPNSYTKLARKFL